MRTVIAADCALALTAATAAADDFRLGDIHVDHPWARATFGQMSAGAADMTVTNGGVAPGRLVGARSDVAGGARIERHRLEDGVLRMRQIDAIEIASGESVDLVPGSLHIMLYDLKEPRAEGQSFPVVLRFEPAGEVRIDSDVEPVGGTRSWDGSIANWG